MAFLCPSRMGRQKKKKKEEKAPLPGRLTGSASVDTLVRVGLEKNHGLNPDAQMVVQQDFSPLTRDEVAVKKGQEVQLVYSENDWAYVITDQGDEGFVPVPYLVPSLIVNKFKVKRRPYPLSPEDNLAFDDVFDDENNDDDDDNDDLHLSTPPNELVREREVDVGSKGKQPLESAAKGREPDSSSHSASTRSTSIESNPQPDVRLFRKHFCGHYVVVFDFAAADEDDVSVGKAEIVAVLNVEDSDWWWVRRGSGQEGFVPRSFILPLPAELDTSNSSGRNNSKRNAIAINHTEAGEAGHVVQILVSREYTARSPDELSVKAGDVIFVDYAQQSSSESLRVFCPRLSRYGLLPRTLLQSTKQVGGSTSTMAIAL